MYSSQIVYTMLNVEILKNKNVYYHHFGETLIAPSLGTSVGTGLNLGNSKKQPFVTRISYFNIAIFQQSSA